MNYEDLDLKYDAVTIVAIDNVNVLVASMNDEYIAALSNHFKHKVKNSQFMPAVKSGNWDGNIRFLNANGLLPRGLLNECVETLQKWGYKYELKGDFNNEQLEVGDFESVIIDQLIKKQDPVLTPRDYQWACAKELIKNRRGVVKAATSSGKSYMITMAASYLLEKKLAEKILLVVPRTDLVLQMVNDASEYGFEKEDIGVYFGREKDYEGKPYVISTWQSLNNIDNREFFEQWDVLIIDECFTGDSLVKTENGEKYIKDIKCGERVWSYNEVTKEKELKEVKKVYENRTRSKKLIKITLVDGRVIRCTPNHLICTENRGWVEAKNLNEEDLLIEFKGDDI